MKIKKYTNILVWVNKKIKNDILPTKCHLTIPNNPLIQFPVSIPTHQDSISDGTGIN